MRFLPVLLLLPALAAQDNLNFLANHTDAGEIRGQFPAYLKRLAQEALARREKKIEAIRTTADLAARRTYTRERILASLGGLPERTPLNARVTGVIEKADYRIEKVIFESQPQFFVTANLYLPKTGQRPYPAVLFPLGHEAGAKAHHAWQQVLASVARKGFVALAWDTLGQGERIQMYDEDFGGSKVVRSTTEHTMQGLQTLLVGDALARYTIWDGIRALDYLLTRPEVDPKRIAVTGNSGGGTHTAYLAALDERLHVAAASCYLTSWKRLIETIGPQDAEQCFPGFLADELDHGDFVLSFAPKPFLILSAIRDFFSIAGARETFREAQRVYERLGASERVAMTEADDGHGYTLPRREAAYGWFARWLQGNGETQKEPHIEQLAEDELWATKTGQVATSLGGETVHSLNGKRVERAKASRAAFSIESMRKLTGFEKPVGPVAVRPFGEIRANGYRIEKIVYTSEPGISVPALLYVPDAPAGPKPAVLVADGRGKAADRSDLEALVRGGRVVLSIDARGLGETRAVGEEYGSDWPRYFGDYKNAMTAVLLRKTLVGMRAADIARGMDLLAARPDVDAKRIDGIGLYGGAIPLLHAVALDGRMRRVGLEGMLVSYEAAVKNRMHRNAFEQLIPGVLKHYDLPDLAASLGPRRVWVADAADAMGNRVDAAAAYPGARHVRRRAGQSAAELFGEMLSE